MNNLLETKFKVLRLVGSWGFVWPEKWKLLQTDVILMQIELQDSHL